MESECEIQSFKKVPSFSLDGVSINKYRETNKTFYVEEDFVINLFLSDKIQVHVHDLHAFYNLQDNKISNFSTFFRIQLFIILYRVHTYILFDGYTIIYF